MQRNDVLGPRRYSGQVDKWFDEQGYGFATINGENVFLHISKFYGHKEVEIKVKEGSKIEAGIIDAVKGRQAVDIEILEY